MTSCLQSLPADVLNHVNSYLVPPQEVAIGDLKNIYGCFRDGRIYLPLHFLRGGSSEHDIEDTPQVKALMKAAKLRKNISCLPPRVCKRFCQIFEVQNKTYAQAVDQAVDGLLRQGKPGVETIVKLLTCSHYLESFYLYFTRHPNSLRQLFPLIASYTVSPSFFKRLLELGEKHHLNLLEARWEGQTAEDMLQPLSSWMSEDGYREEKAELRQILRNGKPTPGQIVNGLVEITFGLSLICGGILFLRWYFRSSTNE